MMGLRIVVALCNNNEMRSDQEVRSSADTLDILPTDIRYLYVPLHTANCPALIIRDLHRKMKVRKYHII